MITETRARYGGVDTRVLVTSGSGLPVVMLHGYADSAEMQSATPESGSAAPRSSCTARGTASSRCIPAGRCTG